MIRIFKLNEYEWFMAETLEDAIKVACLETGLPVDEAIDKNTSDYGEVSQEDMDRLRFFSDIYDNKKSISFRERLDELISQNNAKPGLFATTEW